MLAEAQRQVPVRLPPHVEHVRVVEDALVPVGRRQPEHHLVAGLDGPAVDLDRPDRGAHDVRRGGRPPQHLLHRGRQQVPVRRERLPLAGALKEGEHAARRRDARVLGAAHQQVVAVEDDVVRAEPLAVHLRRGQHAHQVVAGVRGLRRVQGLEVAEDLQVGEPAGERVAAAERLAGQLVQALPVRLGDAHHLADHVQRDPGRDVGHEVDVPAVERPVHHAAGDLAQLRLKRPDRADREPLVHQRPQPAVPRRIGQRQRPPASRVGAVLLRTQQDALRGAERLRVPVRRAHVVITRQRPESGQLGRRLPVHRRVRTQPTPLRERVTV